MTINITIVADQEAFFADATTPTHPPHRWIQAKFFDALNARNGYDVKYDVITDYSKLMTLVGQP